MAPTFSAHDERQASDLAAAANPHNKDQQELIAEMRAHLKKLHDMQQVEDPRLSFSTPQFKEAQRVFTENFKKNFGKPVEWALVQDYPWSVPQLRKVEPSA